MPYYTKEASITESSPLRARRGVLSAPKEKPGLGKL